MGLRLLESLGESVGTIDGRARKLLRSEGGPNPDPVDLMDLIFKASPALKEKIFNSQWCDSLAPHLIELAIMSFPDEACLRLLAGPRGRYLEPNDAIRVDVASKTRERIEKAKIADDSAFGLFKEELDFHYPRADALSTENQSAKKIEQKRIGDLSYASAHVIDPEIGQIFKTEFAQFTPVEGSQNRLKRQGNIALTAEERDWAIKMVSLLLRSLEEGKPFYMRELEERYHHFIHRTFSFGNEPEANYEASSIVTRQSDPNGPGTNVTEIGISQSADKRQAGLFKFLFSNRHALGSTQGRTPTGYIVPEKKYIGALRIPTDIPSLTEFRDFLVAANISAEVTDLRNLIEILGLFPDGRPHYKPTTSFIMSVIRYALAKYVSPENTFVDDALRDEIRQKACEAAKKTLDLYKDWFETGRVAWVFRGAFNQLSGPVDPYSIISELRETMFAAAAIGADVAELSAEAEQLIAQTHERLREDAAREAQGDPKNAEINSA